MAPEVVGARKTSGPGTDDEHPMTGGLACRRSPFLLPGAISHKALDGMNTDGSIELQPIAPTLTGVITGSTVHRGKRIVIEDLLPSLPPSAGLRMIEPGLDILSRRTSRVAGRQVIDPAR